MAKNIKVRESTTLTLPVKRKVIKAVANKGKASQYNDLYFVDSILVSTGMNGNDDTFSPAELWKARKTPMFKPINIEHWNNAVVGCIARTWVMDWDLKNEIATGTALANIPDHFHIACESALFRSCSGDLGAAINELIVSIQAEEKAVSMEVFFDDYDFALCDDDDNIEIIARNDDTWFLTWSLRAWGGSGTFNGKRIGRLLKNMEFSGMAFVSNPANPHSQIIDNGFAALPTNISQPAAKVPFAGANKNADGTGSRQGNLVQTTSANKQENRKMSNEVTVDQKVLVDLNVKSERYDEMAKAKDKAEASLQTAQAATETVKQQLADKVAELAKANQVIEDNKKTYETLAAENQKLSAEVTLLTEAKKKCEDEKAKCEKEKAELQTELDNQKATVVFATRMSKLTSAGLKEDEAKAFVEKHSKASDELFDEMVSYKIAAYTGEKSLASIQKTLKENGTVTPDIMKTLTPNADEPPMNTTASQNADDQFKALQESITAGFKAVAKKQ
jgi:hypothetical protein